METEHGSMGLSLLPRVAVVILAGGKSSRMGQNKALLCEIFENGRSLLDRACDLAGRLLRSLAQDEGAVFVSGSYPTRRCINDLIEGCGPLSGMHAALTEVLKCGDEYQHLLFLPVDMPALEVSTLTRLIESGALGDAAHFTGYELPTLIRAEQQTVNLLQDRLLAQTDRRSWSVHHFLEALSASRIEPSADQAREFVNMNTRADFEMWCRGYEH